MIIAAAGAACSSSDNGLVSPDDSASDARFRFRRTPSAPQNAAATAGDASATVTWETPASSGAARIYSYTIVTSPGNRSTRVSSSAHSATITRLTNGTAYTFTVYAANFFGSGPGAKTNAVTPGTPTDTTTPPADRAPTAPTGVNATAGNAQAVVHWTAPSDPGSSAVASYTVTSSPGGKTATVTAPTVTATVTGLTNGTAYTFTVTAKNATMTSPASAPSTAVTPTAPAQNTAPSAPRSVTATAGNAQATVTWQAPSSSGSPATITGYTVTSTPGAKTATVSGSTLTATITGLTNGTSYTFAVTATNGMTSPAGTSNAVTPSAPVTPPPPSGAWISGYWVGYQRNIQNENQIDMSQLTHIIVGAAEPISGNQLATDFFQGSNTAGEALAKTITSRAHAAGKKAIMMIGGSSYVGALETASSSANRAGFITNLLAAVDRMGFDGIDIDWEPIPANDQASMLALAQGLRSARPNIILTVPISWVYYDASSWYAQLAQYVDQMNFMSYEMDPNYSGWVSWHFSAVLGGEAANHPSSISRSLSAWKGVGVPAAKLGAGVGAYGHCWNGPTAPNQSLSGATEWGGDNTLPYTLIMSSYYNSSLHKWDTAAEASYLSSSTPFGAHNCTYLTYEDVQSVTAKGQYVKAQGMGGIMMWTISQQFMSGAAAGEQNPLITAAYNGLNQ
jgi:chitinase